jgi:hypothetical protein
MRPIGVMHREIFAMVSRAAPAPAFTEAEWRELLAFADRTQLSLHLRGTPGLPSWLAEEIESRFAKNAERRRRLRAAYIEAAGALAADGIEFVLLKGFTHETGFGVDGSARVQYDLDLLTRPSGLARARTVFERLGYAPHGARSLSEEHGRPLVRPSGWSWRGDYYDPEMPIPIELHSALWSAERDRIQPSGMGEFWSRRRLIEVNGLEIPAFCEVDRLAFAALHVLRHILRHDARPAHVLELARFLDARCGACGTDSPSVARSVPEPAWECAPHPLRFWDEWRNLHPPDLRALQCVAFRFAHEWFGCALPLAGLRPAPRSPVAIDEWFNAFAWSPVANLTVPNKDTVWLHLALVDGWQDRARVFCHRMLPLRLPHEGFFDRLRYHAGALAPALASGVRWGWRRAAASTASEISDWKRRSV